MKKIIYLTAVVIGLGSAYAFSVSINSNPYCVKMKDSKGRNVEITIEANGANEAIRKAKSMYPTLKYFGYGAGACK